MLNFSFDLGYILYNNINIIQLYMDQSKMPGVSDDLIPPVGEEEASIVLRTLALAFKNQQMGHLVRI